MVEGMAQAQFNHEPGPGTPAAPQLTVAPRRESGGDDGLSLRTLVIAAVASAAAAILTSLFWKAGTVISAAVTPVIVAIVKEIVERPREVVRRASAFTSTSASPRRAGDPPVAPIRTYGRPPRRGIHLKVALATGLVAFLLAAVALTVPELLFGGSVASKGETTLFGGSGAAEPSSEGDTRSEPEPGRPPAQTPPSTDGGASEPEGSAAQPAPEPEPEPQQPAGEQPSAPAPSAPAPSAPAQTP